MTEGWQHKGVHRENQTHWRRMPIEGGDVPNEVEGMVTWTRGTNGWFASVVWYEVMEVEEGEPKRSEFASRSKRSPLMKPDEGCLWCDQHMTTEPPPRG